MYKKLSKYRCNKCNKEVEIDSTKYWIKSWCTKTQTYSRLYKIEPKPKK